MVGFHIAVSSGLRKLDEPRFAPAAQPSGDHADLVSRQTLNDSQFQSQVLASKSVVICIFKKDDEDDDRLETAWPMFTNEIYERMTPAEARLVLVKSSTAPETIAQECAGRSLPSVSVYSHGKALMGHGLPLHLFPTFVELLIVREDLHVLEHLRGEVARWGEDFSKLLRISYPQKGA